MDPLALAEGAASGRPLSRIRSCIAGWAGQRNAMVSRPAVTREAIGLPPFNGSTKVRGPGQKCPASRSANQEKLARDFAISRSATWTISGLKLGLRSEEHTSELQSLMRISYAVFCLKNKKQKQKIN